MNERREHTRLQVRLDFSYFVERQPWGQMATTEDLSAGGLRASASDLLDRRIRYDLQIGLPDQRPIPAIANVVWIGPIGREKQGASAYEVGLRFVRIEDRDRQRLGKYLSRALG